MKSHITSRFPRRLFALFSPTRKPGRRPPFTREDILDHNIPRKLRRLLKGHYVSIALEMNWTTLRNGDLMRAAEDAGYELMVTADQNLSYQHNLSGRRLSLIVLSTNTWNIIQRNPVPIVSAIEAAIPGSFQYVQV